MFCIILPLLRSPQVSTVANAERRWGSRHSQLKARTPPERGLSEAIHSGFRRKGHKRGLTRVRCTPRFALRHSTTMALAGPSSAPGIVCGSRGRHGAQDWRTGRGEEESRGEVLDPPLQKAGGSANDADNPGRTRESVRQEWFPFRHREGSQPLQ